MLSNSRCVLCSSRKNQYQPHGRSLEIPGGRGGGWVLKAKISEAKYEAKLEFPGGNEWGEGGRGGAKHKTFHEGGWILWIFSGTAHCYKLKPVE